MAAGARRTARRPAGRLLRQLCALRIRCALCLFVRVLLTNEVHFFWESAAISASRLACIHCIFDKHSKLSLTWLNTLFPRWLYAAHLRRYMGPSLSVVRVCRTDPGGKGSSFSSSSSSPSAVPSSFTACASGAAAPAACPPALVSAGASPPFSLSSSSPPWYRGCPGTLRIDSSQVS